MFFREVMSGEVWFFLVKVIYNVKDLNGEEVEIFVFYFVIVWKDRFSL